MQEWPSDIIYLASPFTYYPQLNFSIFTCAFCPYEQTSIMINQWLHISPNFTGNRGEILLKNLRFNNPL